MTITVNYPRPDLSVLAAGLEWLYRTVQPEGAIQQHHGESVGYDGSRYYGFCPSGALHLPVITVNAKGWGYAEDGSLTGALGDGEMAANAAALTTLGVKIREQWNGDGCIHGSFGLVEPAHPSLLAAVARYRAYCPEHESPFCGSEQGCTWYADGSRLIAGPERPEASQER